MYEVERGKDTHGSAPMATWIVAYSPSSSTMDKNFPRVTLKLSSVRPSFSSQSGSLSTRLSSYTLTSAGPSRSPSPSAPLPSSPSLPFAPPFALAPLPAPRPRTPSTTWRRVTRAGSQRTSVYVSRHTPHMGFGAHIVIALRGILGLNCTCTLRSAEYERRRRCSACSTMSPAMIAFVVAIAGMMLPAISARRGQQLRWGG